MQISQKRSLANKYSFRRHHCGIEEFVSFTRGWGWGRGKIGEGLWWGWQGASNFESNRVSYFFFLYLKRRGYISSARKANLTSVLFLPFK